MKENLNLKKQLAKLQKENEFLKKLRHPPSGIRLEAYRFIQNIIKCLDYVGFYANLIYILMLIIVILKTERLVITNTRPR